MRISAAMLPTILAISASSGLALGRGVECGDDSLGTSISFYETKGPVAFTPFYESKGPVAFTHAVMGKIHYTCKHGRDASPYEAKCSAVVSFGRRPFRMLADLRKDSRNNYYAYLVLPGSMLGDVEYRTWSSCRQLP